LIVKALHYPVNLKGRISCENSNAKNNKIDNFFYKYETSNKHLMVQATADNKVGMNISSTLAAL